MTRPRGPAPWLGASAALAALAFDPHAPAASAKRTLGLLVALALLAVAVARPPRVGTRIRVAPAALFFLGFVAWSGISLRWGIPSGAGDLGTWTVAEVLVLVVLPWPARRAREAAGWAALLAGGGAGAFALVQVARGASGIFVHGGQGNANWLGLLTALTLPLTMGMTDAGRRRALVGGSLALQLAGLVLSHSRVAWAAALAGSLPLAFALAWPAVRARRAVAAALTLGALGLSLAASPALAGPAPGGAPAGDVPIPLAWKGRTWIWRTSAAAAVAALPAGAGLGGFAHAYLAAQGPRLARLPPKEASRTFVNATTAHCDWLEVLVDSGPMGLVLLALALGSGGISSLRTRWLPGAAALLSFAVCALGDSPLRQPGVVLILGLALGGLARTVVLEAPARLLPMVRVALLAATALLLADSARGFIGQRRLTAARDAAPDEQRALLAGAARVDPRSGEIALERGLRELDLGHPEAALVELRRSRALLANVGTDVAIGNAEVLLGHPEAAIAAYQAAIAQNPGAFRAHANISQPLVALGRLDEADAHLAIAAELWPGHPRLLEMIDRAHQARIEREAP
jgi:tetratricopeptide (TPR) repeat protein